MKVLAISSSPRRKGNSETLLDEALSQIKRKKIFVKKVVLPDLNIAPCDGCQACFKTGECVIKDDMEVLYRDLSAADILLISSPIFFRGLPCQLKCAIDRCQSLWAKKYILGKKVASKKRSKRHSGVVLVCASPGIGKTFVGAITTLKAWFNTLDFEYRKEFLAPGLEEKDAALKDKKLLLRAEKFGRTLFKI